MVFVASFQTGKPKDIELYLVRYLTAQLGDDWRVQAGLSEDDDINALLTDDTGKGVLTVAEISRTQLSRVHEQVTVGINVFLHADWGRAQGRAHVWHAGAFPLSPAVTQGENTPIAVVHYNDSNTFVRVPNTTIATEQYYMTAVYTTTLDFIDIECV